MENGTYLKISSTGVITQKIGSSNWKQKAAIKSQKLKGTQSACILWFNTEIQLGNTNKTYFDSHKLVRINVRSHINSYEFLWIGAKFTEFKKALRKQFIFQKLRVSNNFYFLWSV